MKENQKLWNKEAKKIAYFVRQDKTHTWVIIDGIVSSLKNKDFYKVYEIKE